jgi:CheY-like chemotaxis protein
MTHILVLDDNADIVSLLRMMLERQGYQVTSGRNGSEGIRLLEQDAVPDLIICNMLMPVADGIAFLDMLRQRAEWSLIPVIMLTALTSDDTRKAAFHHGANAFLPKPFHIADLTSAINNLGIHPH